MNWSTGRWAVLQLWCCPSKTVEHPKSKSTQPSPRGDGSPCIVFAKFLQIEHVSVRSLQICDHMIAHIWYVMNYKCITESDWRLTSFLPKPSKYGRGNLLENGDLFLLTRNYCTGRTRKRTDKKAASLAQYGGLTEDRFPLRRCATFFSLPFSRQRMTFAGDRPRLGGKSVGGVWAANFCLH